MFSLGRGTIHVVSTFILCFQVTCTAVASRLNKDGMSRFIMAVRSIADPYEGPTDDAPQHDPYVVFKDKIRPVSNIEALALLKKRVQVGI